MTTAPVLRAAHVDRPPAESFRLFTEHTGAWWPLPTHGLFGAASGGVAFADGELVERSVTGETAVWAQVLAWDPPHRLALAWHPSAADDGPHGIVEVTFVGSGDGTRVELVHHGWEAYGDRAAAVRRSYVGPSAWGLVLDGFADAADRRQPSDAVAALAGAYDAFFAEALAGPFGEAADGGWNAAQVVAHVAVNDDGMAAMCRALVRGGPVSTFENEAANDRAVLDATVAGAGGRLDALVALGRARAAVLCLLLDRLDDEQLATPVPVRLVDDGLVVLDRAVPWGPFATGTQASFHLPLHTAQLRALRA